VKRYSNVLDLPHPGYKHPRERHTEAEKAAIDAFIESLRVKHNIPLHVLYPK
jgi:hypothetical protein